MNSEKLHLKIKKNWNNLKLTTKSIIIACTLSVIIPLILSLIDNFIEYILNIKYYSDWAILRAPAFLELNLLALSFLWIAFRFILIILMAYLNGLLLLRNLINIKEKNMYLFISSVLIYFVNLYLSFKIFLFLDRFEFIEKIFKLFRFFGI